MSREYKMPKEGNITEKELWILGSIERERLKKAREDGKV